MSALRCVNESGPASLSDVKWPKKSTIILYESIPVLSANSSFALHHSPSLATSAWLMNIRELNKVKPSNNKSCLDFNTSFVQICSSSRAFISIFSSLEWASSNAAHHVTPAMPTNRPKSNDLNNVKLTSTMLHRLLTIAEYSRPKPLSIQNDSRR